MKIQSIIKLLHGYFRTRRHESQNFCMALKESQLISLHLCQNTSLKIFLNCESENIVNHSQLIKHHYLITLIFLK